MIIILLFAGLATFINGYGPHHPRGSHVHYRPPASKENGPKLTQDTQLLRDEEFVILISNKNGW